ncbi:hypothetical protein I8H83_05305 [Candidatus Saccharibacteria bacterium]|nr:hypothetical protein [Candidatus Saccharibacteria bacterium]MBH2007992.1 hypothetical protein [Candidatus Saccharibacteria bacterium]
MSKLIALNCGNTRIIRVTEQIEMSVVEAKVAADKTLKVIVNLPEYPEDRILEISGLHHAKDGWGVRHVVGTIIEEDGTIQVTFYDNIFEADPLNLK